MADIIIMQTSIVGYNETMDTIKKLGLEERVAIFREFEPAEIEAQIDPDKDQMFITGTNHGGQMGVVELVRKFRLKYPKLQCASYAVNKFFSEEVFQFSINKHTLDDEPDSLRGVLSRFVSEIAAK